MRMVMPTDAFEEGGCMAAVPNALTLRNRRRIWRCLWEIEAPGREWRLETQGGGDSEEKVEGKSESGV